MTLFQSLAKTCNEGLFESFILCHESDIFLIFLIFLIQYFLYHTLI